MNKIALLFLSLAVFAIFSCTTSADKKITLQTHKEAIDSLKTDSILDSAIIFSKIDIHKLLDTINLSRLFVNTDTLETFTNRFDGFFGNDNYRIEFYWSEAKKDSLNPLVYHLKGKTNFKGNIDSFTGKIELDTAIAFTDPLIDLEDWYYDTPDKLDKSVLLNGNLIMYENTEDTHSGVFRGDFRMEIGLSKLGELFLWYYSPKIGSMGGGFASQGTWSLHGSTETKPYVFGKDLFMFANNILKDFSYGERDVQINEKYVHLGWDNYWDMKEWWIENPVVQ